jgi:capsular polysaccharide biosynthesis protein
VLVDALAKALVNASQEKKEGNAPRPEVKTIDLVELMCHVLSRIHYVLICALVGAIIMVVQAASAVPVYSATAKLYIVGSQGATINVSDLQLGSMLTMDYEEVFRTWEVHEMVRSQLGVDYTYSQLQSMIRISNPEDTRILYITARHSNAQMAADIANAYASAARTFILQTMDAEEPNLFSVALVPSVASVVSKASNAVKGFMLGAVLAVGVIVLLFVLDDRPRTPEHIQQAADIPTLAVIPSISKKELTAQKRRRSREVS